MLGCSIASLCGCSADNTVPGDRDASPPSADSAAKLRFAEPCRESEDCQSGRCVEMGKERRCSQSCADRDGCPMLTGWSCDDRLCNCKPGASDPGRCNFDGDCDGRPDRTPRAEECNGEDDDCNGVDDDVAAEGRGAIQLFRDRDGDGYGDDGQSKWRCGSEAGWVSASGDCDDDDRQASPGMVEVCGDQLDNDCDQDLDDPDRCGYRPIDVKDVRTDSLSAPMGGCEGASPSNARLDVTQVVANQDGARFKFTVRIKGGPSTLTCASYTLAFGPSPDVFPLVYVYRPGAANSCATLPSWDASNGGKPFTSSVTPGFNPSAPGSVSFIVDKTELLARVDASPTYWIRVCSNERGDVDRAPDACTADTCVLPIHR